MQCREYISAFLIACSLLGIVPSANARLGANRCEGVFQSIMVKEAESEFGGILIEPDLRASLDMFTEMDNAFLVLTETARSLGDLFALRLEKEFDLELDRGFVFGNTANIRRFLQSDLARETVLYASKEQATHLLEEADRRVDVGSELKYHRSMYNRGTSH